MKNENLCPFCGICGSCLYQDLPESEYLAKKMAFITRAFSDYDLVVKPEPIRTVPLGSRRRAAFAYAGGRLGYNAHKSHTIIEITECRLLKSEIVSFLPVLRAWINRLGGKGDVFVLSTQWGLDIHIKSLPAVKPNLAELELLADMARHPTVARLTYNSEPIAEKTHLPFLPDAFLQPSAEGEHILTDLMLATLTDEKTAVDLFCGCGTFTRPLAARGIKTIGYDCSESVELLGRNGIRRDLFRSPLLPEEMNGVDLIVLDPPRAGAKAQVEQIAATHVPKIIMISCNPSTAARDCKILVDAGWHLTRLTPVDQFRWSNHIELVCILEKKQ